MNSKSSFLPASALTEEASILACSFLTKTRQRYIVYIILAKVVLELGVLDWSVPLTV